MKGATGSVLESCEVRETVSLVMATCEAGRERRGCSLEVIHLPSSCPDKVRNYRWIVAHDAFFRDRLSCLRFFTFSNNTLLCVQACASALHSMWKWIPDDMS